ncbi:MAG TPA: DUF3035 domain-containing protein [Acetobacteraceae bacterium]|nr:DUF3035 domain-containing protein [Acetobacteraceae bacterium]
MMDLPVRPARKMIGRAGKYFRFVAVLSALAFVAGCSGQNVLTSLDLEPPVPNAFLVTTQPPLVIPPNLNSIPSPQPGAPRPQDVSPTLSAEETLVPQVALNGTAGPDSAGQQALVAAAGPPPPSNLQEEIAKQAAKDRPGQGVMPWLLFWQTTPPPGIVVDPAREERRLQENAALGRPVTYGQTPIIQPKTPSLF